jgi:flagellar FliL protein
MTEQDKEMEARGAETESKGSGKNWIIIGVVILVLMSGGYAAWDFLLAKRFFGRDNPQIGETGHSTAEAKDEKFGIICKMEPFIVNLIGRDGKRYLKTTIEFEVEGRDMKNAFTRHTPQLRDAILLLLTSKSFEDISMPEGKLRLKNELIARINQILPSAGIRTLYFTEFVVQ